MSALTAKRSSTELCDAELVRRARRGDGEGFKALYRRYQGKVRSTLSPLCGAAVLDDLVQEVFLRAWKGLPRLRQPKMFSTWLYRICWNVASDRRRQFARDREFAKRLPDLAPDATDAHLSHLHYEDAVRRGLASLSLPLRAAIVLHDLEDIPQKQVAEILDIPVGTVKSRVSKGRAALRAFFEKEGIAL